MYRTGFELTRTMYQRAMLETENRRKDEAGRMLDYYQDSQLDYILDDIRSRYPRPEQLYPVGLNVVKKVIRNLAMVYMKDAVRTLDGSETDMAIFS